MIKRFGVALIVLLIVAVLLLGTVFIAPGLVPTDTYRDKIESELSQTLGRDVKITGDIKISTFPSVEIQTGPVSLANPEGFSDNNFVDVQALSAKVKLWPLLKKQVEISGVTLQSPSIRFERQIDGSMNWVLGDTSGLPEKSGETSPYKRDGRFTEYDPSLSLLQISNGQFIYIDASAQREISAEDVNLDLRAPNLEKPVSIKGDLVLDGLAVSLDTTLASPMDFLSGEATAFNANIITSEGTIEASGRFEESEDIAFEANFDTDITAPIELSSRLPLPETLKIPELTTLKAKGNISFGPDQTRFPQIDFAAEGPGLTVNYVGSLDASDEIATAGDFEARLNDISVVTPYLKEPINALDLVEIVDAKGTLDWNGTRLSIPTLNGKIDGRGLAGRFDGSASYEDEFALNGNFEARSEKVAILTPYLEKPIEALNAIETFDAKGIIDLEDSRLNISSLDGSVSGPEINAAFNGNGRFDKTLSLDGSFTGESSNLENLLKTAGIEQADAAALKRITTSGNIALSNNNQVTLTEFTATASEGLVNGQYNGQISYDESLSLTGQISGDIPDLGALNAAIPLEIPYADIAKHVSLSSQITNQGSGYALSGLSATLADGLLTGNFNGQLTTGSESNISGSLQLAATSLRAIAQSQNVDLPISTDVGPIFEGLQLSGAVSGTPNRINFNNGTLGLDSLSGTGNFILVLEQTKPKLLGNLALGNLDLRPYMAAWSDQNPTGQILPWATTPIDLTGLNAIDALIDLTAPTILTDRIQLGQTDTNVKIENGTLTTNIQNAQLYDGQVDGTFALGSRNGTPTLSIQTQVKSVDAMNFLMATSGFEKVSGTADLTLSVNGSGTSQDAIMKSLSGSGVFKVLNGQLLGIEASSLLSGVDQALVNKQLPLGAASGIGGSTDFNDLDGSFSVNQGRATVNEFQVQSRTFFMNAEGVIDVGNQNLDFRMRPMLSKGSNIAQFGIPIQFRGKFGQAKPGLDSDFLGRIVKAKAADAARSAITDRVSGPLGSIISGAIGGGSDASETSEPVDTELESKDLVLSPTKPREEATTAPKKPEEQIEDQIGDALKGLFGKKKKTSNGE